MQDIIERYLYDVVRRLPEKERDEVSKELRGNIYDMLPDDAAENDIEAVLRQLGPPAVLAGQYTQRPRYLISPLVYDEYINVMKIIIPVVGGIFLAIGAIIGILEALSAGADQIFRVIAGGITGGLEMGVEAVFRAAFWTTLGFIIYERTGGARSAISKWKLEKLPEVPADNKSGIPLSDSIAGLVMTIGFSIGAIMVCVGIIPIISISQGGNTQVINVFNERFLLTCIPIIIVMAAFGIADFTSKIIFRQWTAGICKIVVISNFVSAAGMLFLITRPAIFSGEFIEFMLSREWADFDLVGMLFTNGNNLFIIVIAAIVIIDCLATSGHAIYKTIKSGKEVLS